MGSSKLHNIRIKGCGKSNSDMHSLEYYNNKLDHEFVNSVIQDSYMFGIKIKGAKNVNI